MSSWPEDSSFCSVCRTSQESPHAYGPQMYLDSPGPALPSACIASMIISFRLSTMPPIQPSSSRGVKQRPVALAFLFNMCAILLVNKTASISSSCNSAPRLIAKVTRRGSRAKLLSCTRGSSSSSLLFARSHISPEDPELRAADVVV